MIKQPVYKLRIKIYTYPSVAMDKLIWLYKLYYHSDVKNFDGRTVCIGTKETWAGAWEEVCKEYANEYRRT